MIMNMKKRNVKKNEEIEFVQLPTFLIYCVK